MLLRQKDDQLSKVSLRDNTTMSDQVTDQGHVLPATEPTIDLFIEGKTRSELRSHASTHNNSTEVFTPMDYVQRSSNNPVDVLFEAGFHEIFQDPLAPENRTYLSYGTSEPDRKIDYVFIGGPIHLLEAQVIRGEALEISDHLPIRAKFVVGDAPAAPEPEPVMETAPEPLLDGVQDPGMDPAPEMDADTETQNE